MTLRVFVEALLSAGAEFELAEGPARHVQVRRAQPGGALVLFDGRGGEWSAEVVAMGRTSVTVRTLVHDPVERESSHALTIALGMPANERMDMLVEKATELGVAAIQPLVTERSVLRLTGERAERKLEHWQAIAVAACEQCGRTRVPELHPVRALSSWLDDLPVAPARWLLQPGAPLPSDQGLASARAVVLSGPEGGLSAVEADAAARHGFVPLGLGARILRADTAPLVMLAWAALRE